MLLWAKSSLDTFPVGNLLYSPAGAAACFQQHVQSQCLLAVVLVHFLKCLDFFFPALLKSHQSWLPASVVARTSDSDGRGNCMRQGLSIRVGEERPLGSRISIYCRCVRGTWQCKESLEVCFGALISVPGGGEELHGASSCSSWCFCVSSCLALALSCLISVSQEVRDLLCVGPGSEGWLWDGDIPITKGTEEHRCLLMALGTRD